MNATAAVPVPVAVPVAAAVILVTVTVIVVAVVAMLGRGFGRIFLLLTSSLHILIPDRVFFHRTMVQLRLTRHYTTTTVSDQSASKRSRDI